MNDHQIDHPEKVIADLRELLLMVRAENAALRAALEKIAALGEEAIQPEAIEWTKGYFDAQIGEMRHWAYKALKAGTTS